VNEIRRREYAEDRREVVDDVLDRARYGHMATLDPDGWPVVKPMNFARLGDWVWFHRARQGEMSGQLGGPACFAVDEPLAWIPSTWRHAELACPATTYYRSVVIRGRPEVVEDPAAKAGALQAFMMRYQPRGGYRAIRAGDPLYDGPLRGVLVFRLPLAGARCKVKVGQNLDPAARRRVFEELLARNSPGDYQAARAMADVDPALPARERALLPAVEDGLTITDERRHIPVASVARLLAATYWARDRPAAVVASSIAGSYLNLAALSPGGEVVAYARVVSDGTLHAWVHDVVVHPDRRGRGIGRRLMERLVAHPMVAALPRLHLSTLDAMTFYERLGFRPAGTSVTAFGSATVMVRESGAPASRRERRGDEAIESLAGAHGMPL
jgi:nitroimidazol reductase NimA-like FMN-containing flavoprotein (pyridoxamine 5'-phosphate oxidase superfamily)/GNAT superfamily N-acetyltransferase